MLDKKSAKILGLFVLGILMIFMLAVTAIAADVNSPPVTATGPLLTTPGSLATGGSPAGSDNTVTVTAPPGSKVTFVVDQGKQALKSFLETVFGKNYDGSNPLDLAFAKFLVFALIMLIVYGLVGLLPFFSSLDGNEKKTIHWIFSGIVAFLSVMFIPAKEIYGMLVGYGAMAVILTSIIPFALILALSWELSTKPSIANMIIQKIVLWGFSIYLLIKIAVLGFASDSIKGVWPYALAIYGIMLGIVIIFAWKNEDIKNYFLKTQIGGWVEKANVIGKDEALGHVMLMRERASILKENNALAAAQELEAAADRLEKDLKK